MSKTFASPALFAVHLAEIAAKEALVLHEGLKAVAKVVEKTAKAELGHLQPAAGPFNEWEELAESTKAAKEKAGHVYNKDYNPLLNTGELYASIKHEVNGLEAIIGSTSPVMVYQEFGTSHIPPRPVIGPAAFKNKKLIHAILGAAAVSGIVNGGYIHPSLGYDMEV
jgi:HK97 gp10 family phage protein